MDCAAGAASKILYSCLSGHAMRFLLAAVVIVLTVGLSESRLSAYQTNELDRPVEPEPHPDFTITGHYLGPLPIPDIVRYSELPNRMHLDPWIEPPTYVDRFDSRLLPLFLRALNEATDTEIQAAAAYSLARVQKLKLGDVKPASADLLRLLRDTKSPNVRQACAMLAANGDFQESTSVLLQLAIQGNDDMRLIVEPALARWKTEDIRTVWRERLVQKDVTDVAYQLAAEGLVALKDTASVDSLLIRVADPGSEYGLRMAAADALRILDPARAREAATPLMTDSIPSKLLAVTLLDSQLEDAWKTAMALCTDPSTGVASAVWQMIFRHKPELLQDSLETGRQYPDAFVRMTAARTMRLFPNPERLTWLHSQLSDVHIEVRNVARQMLLNVSREHEELKLQIVQEAADGLKSDPKDWQGLEQRLILLGQMKATEFGPLCLPLLAHPRDEVSVSAAWLLHLYPDPALYETIREQIVADHTAVTSGNAGMTTVHFRLRYFFQYAGIVRMKEVDEIMQQQFNKLNPMSPLARAAALWAVGLLHEKSADAELASKYVGRIQDRNSIPPEIEEVRRMSVMGLGLIRASDSADVVVDAFRIDSPLSLICGQARWVLPLLGQPQPPAMPPIEQFTGGWKITPAAFHPNAK
jgi:hypothetical protein